MRCCLKDSDYENDEETTDTEDVADNISETPTKMSTPKPKLNHKGAIAKPENESNQMVIGSRTTEEMADADKLNKLMGHPEKITCGCKVIIHKMVANCDITYIFPKTNEEIKLFIQKKLMDKKVGDKISIGPESYIVMEISW